MLGAVAVAAIAFAIARQRSATWLGAPMQIPTARDIDSRLVAGSLAFGVGWGLVGLCPGPALVALGADGIKALVFFVCMIAGMLVFDVVERTRKATPTSAAPPSISAGKADA
jgi:uncharacterized membrane protein YedE/YeeE